MPDEAPVINAVQPCSEFMFVRDLFRFASCVSSDECAGNVQRSLLIRLVDKPSALNGGARFGVPRLRGLEFRVYAVRSSAFTRFGVPRLRGSEFRVYAVGSSAFTRFGVPRLRGSEFRVYAVRSSAFTRLGTA